jgi:hypothetical protein
MAGGREEKPTPHTQFLVALDCGQNGGPMMRHAAMPKITIFCDGITLSVRRTGVLTIITKKNTKTSDTRIIFGQRLQFAMVFRDGKDFAVIMGLTHVRVVVRTGNRNLRLHIPACRHLLMDADLESLLK